MFKCLIALIMNLAKLECLSGCIGQLVLWNEMVLYNIIANLACNESSIWTCIVQKLRYSFLGADVQYIRLHQIKFKHIAVLWLQAILILFIYGDEWKAAVWNSSSILAVFLCNIHQLLEYLPFWWCYCFQVSTLNHESLLLYCPIQSLWG